MLVPTVLLMSALPGRAADAFSPHGWTVVQSQHVSGSNERALAVVAPAPGDVWAIGYRLTFVGGAAEFRTLAEHYDGTSFVTVATPDREGAPTRDFLNGAAAPASDDIWAVGTTVNIGSPDVTLIEHWDGTSWTMVDSPNPGAVSSELQAAAASSATDVWAVGARINTGSFYQRPMTLHWDGTTWKPFHAPNPLGCSGHSYLTAVTALATDSAWATGWCGSGGSSAERGYVLHWDGQKWSLVKVIGQAIAPYSETYGIAATSASNIWVVGSYRQPPNGTTTALTYHYNGTRWRRVAGQPSAITLAGVTTGSAGVWSVGAGNASQPPFAGPSAGRHRPAGWVDRPVTQIDFGRLWAVTTAPDGVVWAVGQQILLDSNEDTTVLVHR